MRRRTSKPSLKHLVANLSVALTYLIFGIWRLNERNRGYGLGVFQPPKSFPPNGFRKTSTDDVAISICGGARNPAREKNRMAPKFLARDFRFVRSPSTNRRRAMVKCQTKKTFRGITKFSPSFRLKSNGGPESLLS